MFGKKHNSGLFSEVGDNRRIVYDFRRRTQMLFEDYRMVSYKKEKNYVLERMKDEDTETLKKLIAAHAADAANEDCLLERILGPVRAGICYLNDQSLEHMDFYTRQGERAIVDSEDIEGLLEFWSAKKTAMTKEHEHTRMLWNKYCGYNYKEV